MADPVSASLAALTQPATLLVEKVSNAIGRHFDPSQAIRMAEAEAKADRIRAVSQVETEIEVAQLRNRAAERFIQEQMSVQSNMEMITTRAIPHLSVNAEPDKIEDDWVTNFFDKSRIVSDDQMQELWAKVLAGEGNHPGSFSRKTVNLIADLDKRDAELFTNLCRFVWVIDGSKRPLVIDVEDEIYCRLGINFETVGHLESLGLIHVDLISRIGFTIRGLPSQAKASYGDRRLNLKMPDDDRHGLPIGQVALTQAGQELFLIAELKGVNGFFGYIYDLWRRFNFVPRKETDAEATLSNLIAYLSEDTGVHSNPTIIARHPAYSQIVGFGALAIPLILEEISRKHNRPHWFQALHDITGETPAPEETWGKVDEVAAAWLEWGREQGYLS